MSKTRLGKVVGHSVKVNDTETSSVTASDGLTFSQSDDVGSLSADFSVLQEKLEGLPNQVVGFDANGDPTPVPIGYELYGFELDLDEPEPTSKIRYIAQNAGFEPAHMDYTNGVFDYGDWSEAWFIKGIRPCMLKYDGTVAYDLKKDDYTKKADGTASDVADDTFNGNAMVGIPTVWIKVDTRVARKPKFYFSNTKLDETFKAYAHHDDNGNIMPYTYMPIYNGWVDSIGRLRSISGKAPTADQTFTLQITEARANNPDEVTCWDIEKFVDRQLINLLLLMIGKSTDTQTVFGYGNSGSTPSSAADSRGVLPTGTMNTSGLFSGADSDPGNTGVKVFGMEHYWGNLWRRQMGLILSSGVPYYKLTKDTSDGSEVNVFDPSVIEPNAGAPTGWIRGGTISGGTQSGSSVFSGIIVDMYAGEFGLMQKTVASGNSDTNFCDMSWRNTDGNKICLFGGNFGSLAINGAFITSLSNISTDHSWSHSACISCKPNVPPPR